MTKRILAALLTLVMALALLPATAFAVGAPSINTGAKKVFANGTPITIEAGQASNTSMISYMDGGTRKYLHFDGTSADAQAAEADLSEYSIFGGANDTEVASASVTMTGGNVDTIYGGGDAVGSNVTGSATVTVSGGTASYVYGGGYLGNVRGNTSVTIGSGAAIMQKVFGGGEGAQQFRDYGNVTGSATVAVNGAIIGDNVYVNAGNAGVYGGGLYGAVGSTDVTFNGGTIYGYLYGGGHGDWSKPDAGKVMGDTWVTLQSGTVQRVINPLDPDRDWIGGDVCGGGMFGTVAGSTTVLISGGKVMYHVYGGGKKDNSTVGGSTSVEISGGEIENFVCGGGDSAGVTGNTSVAVSGGTLKMDVFGGCAVDATVGGSTAVTVTGGSIGSNVYGGGVSNAPVNGDSTITITGGTVSGEAIGGCMAGTADVEGVKNGWLTAGVSFSDSSFDNVLGKDKNGYWWAVGAVSIPAGMSITVDAGKTMMIRSGATLTNNGSLTVNGIMENVGTFIHNGVINGSGSINGGLCKTSVLKAEYIDIPDVYLYTGNEIFINRDVKILGWPFDFVGGTWARAISPDPVKERGSYTATYSKAGERNIVKTFRVADTTTPPDPPAPGGGYTGDPVVTLYNDPSQPQATIWLSGSGLSAADRLITERDPGGSAYKALLKLAGSNDVFATYNIYLASGAKGTGGAMYLTFDLNEKYAGQTFTLVHQKANGEYETFTAVANEKGDLTFGPLFELSPFMLVKGTMGANALGVPDTGDSPVWLLLLCVVMVVGTIIVRKQRCK